MQDPGTFDYERSADSGQNTSTRQAINRRAAEKDGIPGRHMERQAGTSVWVLSS